MAFNIENDNTNLIEFLKNTGSGFIPSYIVDNYGDMSIGTLKTFAVDNANPLPIVMSLLFYQMSVGNPESVVFNGSIINNGSSPITQMGVVYGASPNPSLGRDGVYYATTIQSGSFSIGPSVNFGYGNVYARTFATNASGTSYGFNLLLDIQLCLVKGTMINLYDGTKKAIENITYKDKLSVWDFDNGELTSAYPLWIMKARKASKYNLLKFSDGSTLKTVGQHRIFNKQKGSFTYPMPHTEINTMAINHCPCDIINVKSQGLWDIVGNTLTNLLNALTFNTIDDTPIGTETYKEDGNLITLVSKEIIHEEVECYNVITSYHINLFADGILTSCKYNNIYPIENMKFKKTIIYDRAEESYFGKNEQSFGSSVDENRKYFNGLRLSEQPLSITSILKHMLLLKELSLKF